MSELTTNRNAATIAEEINQIKAQARDVAIRACIEIGKRLHEAKALIPYGSWGKWLEDNVEYSERKAQELMAIADEYGRKETRALAEIRNKTQALLLLALDPGERDAFVQEHNMETISTRELEDEIKRLQEENAKKQLTIDELLGMAPPPEPAKETLAVVDEQELADTRQKLADAEKSLDSARAQVLETEKRREEDLARERAKADHAEQERAKAARERDDARRKAEAQEKQIKRMEDELEEARQQVRTVEVLPQDVEAELARLRAQVAKSSAESELRAAYDVYRGDFERLMSKLEDARTNEPETAEKYRAVFHKATIAMAGRMKD